VKSWGRKVIQEVVYHAVDLGVEVFYANTDSIFIRRKDIPDVCEACGIRLGTELGEFKIEKEFTKFICLSQRKWWMRLVDGTEKHSFGQDGEEWWENELRKACSQ
jgi:DNA polymerase elongation subunit (family B)